jgi:hypothetical protein
MATGVRPGQVEMVLGRSTAPRWTRASGIGTVVELTPVGLVRAAVSWPSRPGGPAYTSQGKGRGKACRQTRWAVGGLSA